MFLTHKSTLYLATSPNLTNGKRCQQILEQRNLPLPTHDTIRCDTRWITHRIHIGQQLFSGGHLGTRVELWRACYVCRQGTRALNATWNNTRQHTHNFYLQHAVKQMHPHTHTHSIDTKINCMFGFDFVFGNGNEGEAKSFGKLKIWSKHFLE